MDTLSAITALLRELGAPAITVVGFGLVLLNLSAVKKDMSELKTEFKADISELRAEVKADIVELNADVKSIKRNRLPHIEAAIKELSMGTP
jgi:hypothetical protein